MKSRKTEALEQRLERLERELRRWRALGSAAVVLVGMFFLLGATSEKVADEIRAKSFVLVDRDGGVRAILDVAPVFDIAGLRLLDTRGKARAALAVAGDGSAGLNLYDQVQVNRAGISTDTAGTAQIILQGRHGIPLWKAP